MANRNRTAGNGWELTCSHLVRSIWNKVITTRKGSRERDAQKIDLMNEDEWQNGRIPLDIQCKNVEGKMDIPKLLGEMKSVNHPKRYKHFVIFHKMTKKTGSKAKKNVRFMPVGEYAYCELSSLIVWLRLVKRWYWKAKQFDALKRRNESLKDEVDELRKQVLRLIEL